MMRIVFFSYRGSIGARCLQWLLQRPDAEVVAVVTWPDYVHPDLRIAVKEVLYDTYIPLYQPRNVNDAAFASALRRLEPDLFVSMYFGKVFQPELLAIPRYGCVNVHNSLLPRYRGQAPDLWAVANGDSEAGQTMHYLDEGVDSGDIIASLAIPIAPDDTGYSLGVKLEDLGVRLFKEAFPAVLSGTAKRTPQDHSLATRCRAPRPEDARIDWQLPARSIANFVRAFTRPYMGAYSLLGGRKVRIWRVAVVTEPVSPLADGIPGQLVATLPHGPAVRCQDGLVELLDFSVDGMDEQSGRLWLGSSTSPQLG